MVETTLLERLPYDDVWITTRNQSTILSYSHRSSATVIPKNSVPGKRAVCISGASTFPTYLYVDFPKLVQHSRAMHDLTLLSRKVR